MKRLLAATTLLLAGCATPPKEFTFHAVNSYGKEIPCLFVVNGDWAAARKKPRFVQGQIKETLVFVDEAGYVDVTLQPTRKGPDGKLIVPESDHKDAFMKQNRRLRYDDPNTQLFLLKRDEENYSNFVDDHNR